jgi:hypothetical protein
MPGPFCKAVTVIWDGSEDDEDDPDVGDNIHWGDPFNWDTDAVPGPGDDAHLGSDPVLVASNNSFLTGTVDIPTDGELNIQGSLSNVGMENDGEVFIDHGDTPGSAELGVGNGGILDGNGEVILGDSNFTSTGARLVGPALAGNATSAASHTIRGEGTIAGNWINNGLIRAEDASGDGMGTLRFTHAMTNHGVIRSSPTGIVDLQSQNVSGSATGRIIADTSVVHLNNSAITGGTLEAENGGYFDTVGNSLTLNQVHNLARIDMISVGATVPTISLLGGGITNDGTIVVQANANPGSGTIFFSANGILDGSGEVILNREGLGASVRSVAGVVGTNGADHTIRGIGTVNATLINDGTIIAEPRPGGTILQITDAASSHTLTNNNLIRADAGGILRLVSARVTQDDVNGRIVANGGTVELSNNNGAVPLVSGGRFQATGDGKFDVTASTRLHNITNEAPINVNAGTTLSLGGTHFTNDGTITLKTTSPFGGGITARSNLTLDGDGEIVLEEPISTGISRVAVETGFTLTHAAEHTIRGEGLINIGGDLGTLRNRGRIEGNSAADDIEIRGTLTGDGPLKNVTIINTHAPGESTAIVPIEGAYAIRNFGGRLEMEIGGTTPGTGYDQLLSSDPANIIAIGTSQTTLKVSLIDDFVPAVGDMFTIISTAGTISGDFAVEDLPLAAGDHALTWDVHYNPSNLTLEVVSISGLPGDFNFDGAVDAADYVVWRKNGGTQEEFNTWRSNFGATAGGASGLTGDSSSQANVPEPGAMIPATIGFLAAVQSLTRKRRVLKTNRRFA